MIPRLKIALSAGAFILSASLLTSTATRADPPGDPKAVSSTDGKYVDKDGNPTYNVKDGKVDFYSYVGFQQYGANCLQCHGPDGLGSSYAPSLVDSLKSLDYSAFIATVIGGKKDVNASNDLVMPAFGENKNVMCYLDPIYIYLRGRSTGAIGRDRPDQHEDRPAGYEKTVDACFS